MRTNIKTIRMAFVNNSKEKIRGYKIRPYLAGIKVTD